MVLAETEINRVNEKKNSGVRNIGESGGVMGMYSVDEAAARSTTTIS